MLPASSEELAISRQDEGLLGLGLNLDTSRACMLADTLALAVRRGMPLDEALTTLPFYYDVARVPSFLAAIYVLLLGPALVLVPIPWLVDIGWSLRIDRVISDLNEGEKLGVALRRHFRRRLPDFYLLGADKAESEGALPTALPVLAHQLNFPCAIASDLKSEAFLVLVKLFLATSLVFFVSANIAPKLQMAFEELSERPALFPSIIPLAGIALFLQLAVLILVVVLFLLPRLGRLGEYALLHIPVVGREMKRVFLGDVARGMAAFLRQGKDMVLAAEWALEASSSHWMRVRLQGFISSVRNGRRWDDAWLDMGLGDPLHEWVIGNAAAREDPANGFELLSEWIHQQAEYFMRRLAMFVDPCCTLALALFVGSLAHYVFSCLVGIVHSFM